MPIAAYGARMGTLSAGRALMLVAAAAGLALASQAAMARAGTDGFLQSHLLVTWYGNPHSRHMGILGELSGAARAAGLRRQADAFSTVTTKTIVPAYHLVAVIAQPAPQKDGSFRRRESRDIIQGLLDEAREHGFHLVLDVQPGRARVRDEVAALRAFLAEPDVHLALDPEFAMSAGGVPGQRIGAMHASEINDAIEALEALIAEHRLPRKVLIIHQFTLAMLPDKDRIRPSRAVDVVLNMDGFGSQALKQASYRAIMRQRELDFAGVKMFYKQDQNVFSPAEIMRLRPVPSVVIYQ
jgi:hypothetical protein